MTNWGKVAGNSADKVDAALAAGLEKLKTKDISGLFPVPADKEKIAGLIAKINSSSSYNERAAAFKAVAATLGADALKVLKGAMLCLALLCCAAPARAEQITVIDLNAPLADARIGLAWGGQGQKLGIAYVPLIYWVGAENQEYATFNLGASDKLDTGKTGYLVSVGPRLDTLFIKLAGSAFAKKHLRFASLPPMQVNLNFVTGDFRAYVPYLSLCKKF